MGYVYRAFTSCTIFGVYIGPYMSSDTCSIHFYTSELHPVHVVYGVYRAFTSCTMLGVYIGPYITGDTLGVYITEQNFIMYRT